MKSETDSVCACISVCVCALALFAMFASMISCEKHRISENAKLGRYVGSGSVLSDSFRDIGVPCDTDAPCDTGVLPREKQ